jgi:hypothetical protein
MSISLARVSSVTRVTRTSVEELNHMTASQLATLDVAETAAILGWRFSQLVGAGFDIDDAVVVAARVEIDLHCATALVAHGCPSQTAVRILL